MLKSLKNNISILCFNYVLLTALYQLILIILCEHLLLCVPSSQLYNLSCITGCHCVAKCNYYTELCRRVTCHCIVCCRPENIRSLYEQVANLDCMLTSLETQIEVISSVHSSLPKEFHGQYTI